MGGDRSLRPERLDFEPSDPEASKKWAHWKRCFISFINSIDTPEKPVNKLDYLIQLIGHTHYELLEDADNYDSAVATLDGIFKKKINVLYARHILLTRRQKDGETIIEFLTGLKTLAKDCDFASVNASANKEAHIRDAFISGLINTETKRKILESSKTSLEDIINLSQIYEDAKSNAESFSSQRPIACSLIDSEINGQNENHEGQMTASVNRSTRNNQVMNSGIKCGWCGLDKHPKFRCPAKNATCNKCQGIGHWARVCRSSASKRSSTASTYPLLASLSSVPTCLEKSITIIGIKGNDCQALWDTGSAENYIHPTAASRFNLKIMPEFGEVSLANTEHHTETSGYVITTVMVNGKRYENTKLTLLNNACVDVILGIEFLSRHKQVTISYGGQAPPLVASLGTLKVDPPALFHNLTPDCHPIRTKSRRFTFEDRDFVKNEVKRLLEEGIIEKSNSPWRAQVHVTGGGSHKKRLVVDYSRTINQFTELDAYPLPRIDELVNKMAQYKVFSTVDLKSAYHQIPLKESDKPYTGFEADGGLYHFNRIPFGVTNGVSCFQREMDRFVEENELQATFPYLDNITICGKDQIDHDKNLGSFLRAAHEKNLTYNEEKCEFSITKLHILGSVIEHGEIRPDPNRLRPLLELPPPTDMKAHRRLLGFFSYYSQWIRSFSQKIKPLVIVKEFPYSSEELQAFQALKREIAESVVCSINENVPFTVETDASQVAIAATLNQSGRPVAFFSRTLHGSELKHSSVEKEAQAIVEAVRHWRHFLTGRHFNLVTDQKSVSFMFHSRQKGKIKNEKIMRWRMDLMCYHFDITYKPGLENVPPDTFSRGCVSSVMSNSNKLRSLHVSLSHPGITRMVHFVKTRNLPYSIEEIRSVNSSCRECAEVKPRYFKPETAKLIKSTQPFERLNVDFKGPLPSTDRNKYFLHVVDEYSRFPFVFPCPDMTSATVIKCFCTLFSMFGMPSFIHSDRGSSFLSRELREFLHSRGISCSRTTPYNPEGNGQVEKENHTIWRTITLALRSKDLPQSHWQEVLPDALHSVRTLLCTATNATPHERLFNFQRKSGTGRSLPSWLSSPGPVLLRRFVRRSKQDPLVDEVDLIEANPQYAFVRRSDGTESTVSIRDLAPRGDIVEIDKGLDVEKDENVVVESEEEAQKAGQGPNMSEKPEAAPPVESPSIEIVPGLRRSGRNPIPTRRLITEM